MEQYLIEHCAPTLASMKTGSLFRFPYKNEEEFVYGLRIWCSSLSRKGISIAILKKEDHMALVYIYRKKHLAADLEEKGVPHFLRQFGYPVFSAEEAVNHLKWRCSHTLPFPHEIGLFLGYPLEDVKGFIEHGGKNCKYCGFWKVYANEREAEKIFAKFRKCTTIYKRLFQEGKTVSQLTVAA